MNDHTTVGGHINGHINVDGHMSQNREVFVFPEYTMWESVFTTVWFMKLSFQITFYTFKLFNLILTL